MQQLLVVGIDSMLGANIALALTGEFRVLGASLTAPCWLDGCEVRFLADEGPQAVAELVNASRPDWVVYCPETAADSWRRRPEIRPQLADEGQALAEAAQSLGCSLTVLSSDAVLQGPRIFQDEQARGFAGHDFAQQALRLERIAEAAGALVVRTHAYGWSPCREEFSLAETAWRHLVERVPLAVDSVRYATPILAADLALLLVRAFRLGLTGQMHIAGAERATPRRFVEELAAACGHDAGWLWASQAAGGPSGATPQETSLSTLRARTLLKTPMPLLRPGLERLAAQLAAGHRQRLREGWPSVVRRRVAA